MAWGAPTAQIRMLVLRRAAALTAVGLGLGVPLALALARMVANLVFGISSSDLRVFVGTSAAVAVIAMTATILPVHRATSVEPMRALRSE